MVKNIFLKLKKALETLYYHSRMHEKLMGGGGVMVFNATLNNISVMSWQSVLLVEETGVPRENHQLTNFIT